MGISSSLLARLPVFKHVVFKVNKTFLACFGDIATSGGHLKLWTWQASEHSHLLRIRRWLLPLKQAAAPLWHCNCPSVSSPHPHHSTLQSTTSIQTFSDIMQLLLTVTTLATFVVSLAQASPVATVDTRSCTIPQNETHQTTLNFAFTLQSLALDGMEWTDRTEAWDEEDIVVHFHVADDPMGLTLSRNTQTIFELKGGILSTGKDECNLLKMTDDEIEHGWNDGIGATILCGIND